MQIYAQFLHGIPCQISWLYSLTLPDGSKMMTTTMLSKQLSTMAQFLGNLSNQHSWYVLVSAQIGGNFT